MSTSNSTPAHVDFDLKNLLDENGRRLRDGPCRRLPRGFSNTVVSLAPLAANGGSLLAPLAANGGSLNDVEHFRHQVVVVGVIKFDGTTDHALDEAHAKDYEKT